MDEDTGLKPNPFDLREALKGGFLPGLRAVMMAMAAAPLVYAALALFVASKGAGAEPDPVFMGLLAVVSLGQAVFSFVFPMMTLKKFRYPAGLGVGERGRLLGGALRGYYLVRSAVIEAISVQALLIVFLYGGQLAQPLIQALIGAMAGVSLWIASLWPSEDSLQELVNRAFSS